MKLTYRLIKPNKKRDKKLLYKTVTLSFANRNHKSWCKKEHKRKLLLLLTAKAACFKLKGFVIQKWYLAMQTQHRQVYLYNTFHTQRQFKVI